MRKKEAQITELTHFSPTLHYIETSHFDLESTSNDWFSTRYAIEGWNGLNSLWCF